MADTEWIDLTEAEYREFLWNERNKTIDRDDTLKVEHLVCLHQIAQQLKMIYEQGEQTEAGV